MRQVYVLLFFLVSVHAACTQDITNLNPKVRILDGEAFYIHHVLEGQTLAAIAKAYVSSESAIRKNNPGIGDLSAGMKLRVPYSDASAAVMSKYDLKLDDQVSAEVYAEEPEKPAKEEARDEPMEEAVALLEPAEPSRSELSEEEQAALADLTALSTELRSSMNSLKSAEDKVKSKPVMDKDGLPKREPFKSIPEDKAIVPKGALLSEFLEAQVQPMIEGQHQSGVDVLLKEYFLVRVNTDGIITNVRDERTEMNGNTFVLKADSLKGFQLIDHPEELDNQFQSIGLVAEVHRDTFEVKFKQSKIKYYDPTPTSEEAEMIEAYQTEKQLWGKYLVVVAEAKYYLATYEQVEFNPFGEIRNKIYFNSEKRVAKSILK